jgi:hypothetical protein
MKGVEQAPCSLQNPSQRAWEEAPMKCSHFDGSDLPSFEGFNISMEQHPASQSAMPLKCRNALGESLCQGLIPG